MPPKLSSSTPGEKLLSLYTMLMLQGSRATSLGEMAQALECSKQTVKRLLDQLEASGYGKLEEPTIQGREHYYRLAPLHAQSLDLGVQELAQISQCRNMLINILPKSVLSLLEQLSDNVTSKTSHARAAGSSQSDHRSLIYSKGYIDYSLFEKQYSTLLQAIQLERVCKVQYQPSPAKPIRLFSFAPMRVVSYRESISFIGWQVSEVGKAKPMFEKSLYLNLQRFKSVKLTSRKAVGLPQPQIAQNGTTAYAFGIQTNEVFKAKLHFSPDVTGYIYDRQWSSDQKCEVLEDGSLVLDFSVQSEQEVLAWILSFRAKVVVLEPAWLREKVVASAHEIAERYER